MATILKFKFEADDGPENGMAHTFLWILHTKLRKLDYKINFANLMKQYITNWTNCTEERKSMFWIRTTVKGYWHLTPIYLKNHVQGDRGGFVLKNKNIPVDI